MTVAEPILSAADVRRLDRLALRTRRRARGDLPGERRSRRIGSGGEFADHRAYAPGDDLRYVDWHAYARLGQLVVKRFEAVDSVRVLLCVDRSASMAGAKSRDARRIAAALAHVALRRRDTVTFAWLPSIPDRPPVDVFRDPARIEALFDALALAPDAGPTRHAPDLDRVMAAAPRPGPAVLVSDFFDPAGAVRGLSRLRAGGFETTAVHLLDPSDAELPVGESVRCTDRETGETLDLDVTPEVAEGVRAAWSRRAERLRAWCAARSIGWVAADAGRSLWDVLRDLRRAGLVAGS
ncbi:MAG TPA: DUF58 domain-containing protein [Planctomycetota bacterium]|nr:DUF58 domain-containing protein [Planctomycetota bacterium]